MPAKVTDVCAYIREHSVPDARGCWVWRGRVDRSGYGCAELLGEYGAHRVAFRGFKGEIPVGYHIDHLCRVRACVNPAHLDVVTPLENWRRGLSISSRNATATHCVNGHALEGDNVGRVAGSRRRVCRQCDRIRHRRQSEARA